MLVSELQIGQNVTVGYWYRERFTGDDYAIVTGEVDKLLECYGSARLKVVKVEGGGRNWHYLWVDDKSEILSINN